MNLLGRKSICVLLHSVSAWLLVIWMLTCSAGVPAASPQSKSVEAVRVLHQQGCASCHLSETGKEPPQARDLSQAGSTYRQDWLQSYLSNNQSLLEEKPPPQTPGAAQHELQEDVRGEVIEALMALNHPEASQWQAPQAEPLTAYQRAKALQRIQHFWECLGCHSWQGEGGRMAPDLAPSARKLRGEYVWQMILSPRQVHPETIMPTPMLMEKDRPLLFALLTQLDPLLPDPVWGKDGWEPKQESGIATYLDVTKKHPAHALYQKHCTFCHGPQGKADGINAPFLNPPATLHADAERMKTRGNDALFDAIHAGGRIMNQSVHMPAWGATFSELQIQQLVDYIRVLCQCQPPSWSQDPPFQPKP